MAVALDASTPPAVVASHFAKHGTLIGLAIAANVSVGELEQIARVHMSHPHGSCVLDLVVAHPAADTELLETLSGLAPGSTQLANSIAMSPKAPVALLHRLATSETPGVRDHARMALLERELADADEAGFAAALDRFASDESLGYAVRARIVEHPEAPTSVLDRIATFADATGQAARKRLGAD